MENESMRQSASTAEIISLKEDEYVAIIHSAIIGKVTCGITAVFPSLIATETFLESFGFSAWKYRNLRD